MGYVGSLDGMYLNLKKFSLFEPKTVEFAPADGFGL